MADQTVPEYLLAHDFLQQMAREKFTGPMARDCVSILEIMVAENLTRQHEERLKTRRQPR